MEVIKTMMEIGYFGVFHRQNGGSVTMFVDTNFLAERLFLINWLLNPWLFCSFDFMTCFVLDLLWDNDLYPVTGILNKC